jgi:hypothetical protein
VIWAGDFNTCPNSVLYDVIKTGDFSKCAKYKKFEWSGQNQIMKLWHWSALPWYKKFNIAASKFNQKNDKRMKIEPSSHTFIALLVTLNLLQLNVEEN